LIAWVKVYDERSREPVNSGARSIVNLPTREVVMRTVSVFNNVTLDSYYTDANNR